MARLTPDNSSVDKDSGAVIFHKSPELLELAKIKTEMQEINQKLDKVLAYIEGGAERG